MMDWNRDGKIDGLDIAMTGGVMEELEREERYARRRYGGGCGCGCTLMVAPTLVVVLLVVALLVVR